MKLLVLLLLAPSLALSQGLNPSPPGGVRVSYLPDDALTAAHVYWTPGGIVDRKGNVWVKSGSVVLEPAASSPFTAGKVGASGWNLDATAFYTLGSGADVLDFTGGEYTCHAVFKPARTAGSPILASNGDAGAAGWIMQLDATNKMKVFSNGTTKSTAGLVVDQKVNVVSWGRVAGSHYIKLNGAATDSGVAAYTAPTTIQSIIGKYPGGFEFQGTIYEIACSATPWSEAPVAAVHAAVKSWLKPLERGW